MKKFVIIECATGFVAEMTEIPTVPMVQVGTMPSPYPNNAPPPMPAAPAPAWGYSQGGMLAFSTLAEVTTFITEKLKKPVPMENRGTAQQAMEYALNHSLLNRSETFDFLNNFNAGETLVEYPGYFAWLSKQ
jgi:hypothetical protein